MYINLTIFIKNERGSLSKPIKKFIKNEKNIPPTVVRPGYTKSYNRKVVGENPERFRYKSQEELNNRK